MRSYLEILKELRNTVELDNIPFEEKMNIKKKIAELANMLWPFSD